MKTWTAGEAANAADLNSNFAALSQIIDPVFAAAATLVNRNAVYIKPYQSDGGISYNSGGTGGMSQMNATYTTSFTVAAGNNRMLVISVYCNNTNGYGGSVAITFDGVAMTQAVTGGSNPKIWTFVLPAPSVGTKTLAITTSGFGNTLSWSFTCLAYNNVVQSTTLDATASAGSGTSLSITTVANGCVVVGSVPGSITTGLPNNRQSTSNVSGDSGQLFPPQTYTFTWPGSIATAVSLAPIIAPVFGIDKASASVAGTSNTLVGFVLSAVSAGSNGTVRAVGIIDGLSGLVVGGTYYLANTAGAISLTPGTVTRKIGIAISATQLLITNVW